MARIRRMWFLSWDEVDDECPEMQKFAMIRDVMPDKKLIRVLRDIRGNGCNKFPVEGMWNALIAGVLFGHRCIEDLRRELMRNPTLRRACGLFNDSVPSPAAFSRFLAHIIELQQLIDEILEELVLAFVSLCPDAGKHLAIDSKAVESHASRQPSNLSSAKSGIFWKKSGDFRFFSVNGGDDGKDACCGKC